MSRESKSDVDEVAEAPPIGAHEDRARRPAPPVPKKARDDALARERARDRAGRDDYN